MNGKSEFAIDGYYWVNHEGFAEVAARWVQSGGPVTVFWAVVLMVGVGAGLVWAWNARAGLGWMANTIGVVLFAIGLGGDWNFSAQHVNLSLFAGLILLLNWSFFYWRGQWHLPVPGRVWFSRSSRTGKEGIWSADDLIYSNFHSRFLWVAPLLFCLWAYSHQGFMDGLAVYGIYLTCRTVEAFGRRGRLGWGLARRMALMFTVAVLATLMTSYSWRLPVLLIESVYTGAKCEPSSGLVGLVLATALVLSATRRSWDFTQVAVLMVVFLLAVFYPRWEAYGLIVCGLWIAPHVDSILRDLGGEAR